MADFFTTWGAWHWLVLGVVLLGIELAITSTYLLWPAVAALCVGILLFIAPMGWEMQLMLFFVISVATLVLGRTHFQKFVKGGEVSDVNDPGRAMIGRQVRAIADFDGREGRVSVGDTQWKARMEAGTAADGDLLTIVGVTGATLIVER